MSPHSNFATLYRAAASNANPQIDNGNLASGFPLLISGFLPQSEEVTEELAEIRKILTAARNWERANLLRRFAAAAMQSETDAKQSKIALEIAKKIDPLHRDEDQ